MTDDLFDLNGLAASLEEALAAVLAEAGADAAAPPPSSSPSAGAAGARRPHDERRHGERQAARGGRRASWPQALGERWLAGPGAAVCDRFEVAGPGFLNLFLRRRPGIEAHCRACSPTAPTTGGGVVPAAGRAAHQRRVRERQPGRAAARRQRPLRRDGRCPLPHLRLRGPRGHRASTTSTTPARRWCSSARRSRHATASSSASTRDVPENGYQGDYVVDLARRLVAEVGDRYRDAVEAAAPDMACLPGRRGHRDQAVGPRPHAGGASARTLGRLRVHHDVWTQRELHVRGRGRASRASTARSASRWPTSTARACSTRRRAPSGCGPPDYGDDKDRVLIRSTGESTYFLSRHRLPPRQDGPRLRAHDRHLGRRPPRLRAAHEGRLHGAAPARPAAASSSSSGSS